MGCSPSESVEVEVNGVVVSTTILSEVAKIDRSVLVVMRIPVGILEISSRDVSFSSRFEDNVCFI